MNNNVYDAATNKELTSSQATVVPYSGLIKGPNAWYLNANHQGSNYVNGPYSFQDSMSADAAAAALATLQANPVLAGAGIWTSVYIGQGFSEPAWGQGKYGYHFGDVDIAKQPDRPENPGIQPNNLNSSYGNVIPISLGRRRLPGTIIVASEAIPRLEGNREYDVVYHVPVYEDKANSVATVVRSNFLDLLFDDSLDNSVQSEEEIKRKTHTVRIENPSDPSQYVDVEVVDEISFTETNGIVRHVKLNN